MIVLYFLVAAAVTAVEGWVAMLLWGALHSEAAWIPTLSYGASLWLVVLVTFLVACGTTSGRALSE